MENTTEIGPILHKSQWKYNEKDQEVEYSYYFIYPNLTSKTTSEYDDNGNLIKQTRFNSDGSIEETLSYTYEYDFNKNWTKKNRIQE